MSIAFTVNGGVTYSLQRERQKTIYSENKTPISRCRSMIVFSILPNKSTLK